MLKVANTQTINFRFGFTFGGSYYDPISETTPIDVYATVVRGEVGSGSIVQPSVSLLNSSYRIINITLPGSLNEGFATLTFEFDDDHYFSVGDLVSVYGINQSCDGDYEITSLVNSTTITAKKQATSISNITGFNSSLHTARMSPKTSAYFKRVSSSEYQFVYMPL